jgi:D-xylose transport system substrate-binding protein
VQEEEEEGSLEAEAAAAAGVIISLLKGETITADKEANGVPYIAVTPTKILKDNVIEVVTAGDVTAADLCVGDVAAVCTELGIK